MFRKFYGCVVLIRVQLIILLLRPTHIQTIVFEPKSLMNSWQPVTSDEIFVPLDLVMLMGIVQQPTLKCYSSSVAFLETLIFPQTMTGQIWTNYIIFTFC